MQGNIIGVIKRDTRSLDHSSCFHAQNPCPILIHLGGRPGEGSGREHTDEGQEGRVQGCEIRDKGC